MCSSPVPSGWSLPWWWLFIAFPVSQILIARLRGQGRRIRLARLPLAGNLSDNRVWGLRLPCRRTLWVAWNSFLLAVSVGIGTTLLGLAFALVATRTFSSQAAAAPADAPADHHPAFRRRPGDHPVVRPLGHRHPVRRRFPGPSRPGRWIYGFTGVWFAQMLAFTPIAFLVLIGVVEGVSPSLEEAAQTLRADDWTTFQHRLAAADAAGPGQRLSAGLHREPRRFRQSAGALAAITMCSPPRSSLPSSVPSTIPDAPPRSPSCCSA